MNGFKGLLINGREVPSSSEQRFENMSPTTGSSFLQVAAGTVKDAISAVEAASAALAVWANVSFVERRRVLLKAAEILESRRREHRLTFALETGGVASWADMNVTEAASTLREAAGLASAAVGEMLPSHDPRTINVARRTPAGVVLAIVPWNAPLVLAARSVAIALAVGNTVVIRPSEEAPLTAGYLLAEALTEAGIPDGVVNVVSSAPGQGRNLIAAMVEHPAVRRVVFIGSTPVGRSIAELAGRNLKSAVMELGGKNPTVVRADADLELWTPALAFSSFVNAGQVCMATDRIIVHESRAAELQERLASHAKTMVVGDPREADTEVGPLINQKAADSYTRQIADAVHHGARLLTGGLDIDGLYARPVVLAGVSPKAAVYYEESFAPIVSIYPVANDDEAVALANDSEFGLIGSVISADLHAAQQLGKRLKVGAVHVNGPSVGDEPHVPFGGLAASGFGRLGGFESVRTFTEERTFYLHGYDI